MRKLLTDFNRILILLGIIYIWLSLHTHPLCLPFEQVYPSSSIFYAVQEGEGLGRGGLPLFNAPGLFIRRKNLKGGLPSLSPELPYYGVGGKNRRDKPCMVRGRPGWEKITHEGRRAKAVGYHLPTEPSETTFENDIKVCQHLDKENIWRKIWRRDDSARPGI